MARNFLSINGKKYELRNLKAQYAGTSSMGTSTKIVTCPFCDDDIEVYIWSFAGGGKKCDCGAILGNWHCRKLTKGKK